jgi:hypothetical protein
MREKTRAKLRKGKNDERKVVTKVVSKLSKNGLRGAKLQTTLSHTSVFMNELIQYCVRIVIIGEGKG